MRVATLRAKALEEGILMLTEAKQSPNFMVLLGTGSKEGKEPVHELLN
jgi:hypothetical protein